jgi:hypothetical protein
MAAGFRSAGGALAESAQKLSGAQIPARFVGIRAPMVLRLARSRSPPSWV